MKRALLFLAFASRAFAQLGGDAVSARSEVFSPGSGTVTWTHTMGTCSASHGVLYVYLGVGAHVSKIHNAAGDAKYNGVNMTEVGTGADSATASARLFVLLDPTAGAHTISINVDTVGDYGGYSRSFCGASASPTDLTALVFATPGSTATPSTTITPSVAGSWPVQFMFSAQIGSAGSNDGWNDTQSQSTLKSSSSYLIASDTSPHTSSWSWGGGASDWATVGFAVVLNAGAGGTFTITPTTIPSGHSGNITLSLVGSSTSWSSSTRFTMSGAGATGATCVTGCTNSPTVTNSTHVAVVVTTGSGTGTLTLTESVTGSNSADTTVATPALAFSPTTGNTNCVQTLALTGTNTLWTAETAAGLFTVAGGTGSSIGTPTITTNTAGTVALTTGTANGTLTVTDTSTGKTATFTLGATGSGTCAVVGGG